MDDHSPNKALQSADGVDALVRIVDDQRRELEGLRNALRYRSVIEQAKGVLTAVTGEDPDTAFRRLVEQSQNTNQKLTHVAAGVVAQAVMEPPEARPDGSHLFDVPAEGAREQQLVASALSASVSDVRSLARTVLDELSDVGVATVTLTAAQADGSLMLLAYEGMGQDHAAGWERIPLTADVPIADAAYSGRDVLLPDRQARFDRYPGSRKIPGSLEGTASLRLLLGHRCVGVLGLGWPTPTVFDASVRARLKAIATQLAPHVARHALDLDGRSSTDPGVEPGYEETFRALLELIDGPVALLEPVSDDDLLVDLRLEYANPMAADELAVKPGRGLLATYPSLATSGLLDRARQVLATGQPSTDAPAAAVTAPTEQRLVAARLGRIGSLLVTIWQAAP